MFFLDRDRNQNIFDWSPHPKFVSDGTGTKTLNFFSPGPRPGPKFFFDRDRDRDQNFFFHRDRDQNFFFTGTGTGTKTFFSPGPGPNFFSHRDRDRDQKWLVPLMSSWMSVFFSVSLWVWQWSILRCGESSNKNCLLLLFIRTQDEGVSFFMKINIFNRTIDLRSVYCAF